MFHCFCEYLICFTFVLLFLDTGRMFFTLSYLLFVTLLLHKAADVLKDSVFYTLCENNLD